MVRYRYAMQAQPPAPIVVVSIGDCLGNHSIIDRPALLDTGADQSAISHELAVNLNLPQQDLQAIVGFGGKAMELPTSLVRLAIHDLPPVDVEVVAQPGQSMIILGRDVLNRYHIALDGPNLAFEIG